MRVLALDLGTRRVGVAVTDPSGTIASPHSVIERSGDDEADRAAVAALVREIGAEVVVVGLPLSLSGGDGPAARAARAEAAAIGTATGVPVELFDERLTTVSAERVLVESGVRGKDRRQVVDKVAAAVLLQAWLERSRSAGPPVPRRRRRRRDTPRT